MSFLSLLFNDPKTYFLWVFLVIFSVSVHEYFHALSAHWQGDNTAAIHGHLTLNPLVQMGITSIIFLFLIGIAWGSTPVNPTNFRKRYSHAIVSFAGPFSNILLFLSFCLILAISIKFRFSNEGLSVLCLLGATLNFVLFVFNMLPIPPLDGFTVASHFFPSLANRNSELKNAAMFIIFIFVFLSFDKLYAFGNYATTFTVGKLIYFMS
ncbi:MAG TPA: site-2 protease family protein [Victivallales bacterium]|nr:site-2 protease family protein [Victivallales bacterium]HPO91777.1 site-2 protease family protein [Victivallales bacterium]HRU00589.1 site-2 protease family protein [Victivallales bacterium]